MTTSPPEVAGERQAFEAWASDNGQWPKAIARNGDNYLLAITQCYWSAWQARASTAAKADAGEWRSTYHLDEPAAAMLRDFIGKLDEAGEASPITLHVGDGHSGLGLYVSLTEYPDEGSVQLVAASPKTNGGMGS
jgi:hypothetical protein